MNMGKLEKYINDKKIAIENAEKANKVKHNIILAQQETFKENIRSLNAVFLTSINNISKKDAYIIEVSRKNEHQYFEISYRIEIIFDERKNFISQYNLIIIADFSKNIDHVSFLFENSNAYGKIDKMIAFEDLLKSDFETVLNDLLMLWDETIGNKLDQNR